MDLSVEAVRVLGCLLEKERTVPDTYPMTLNGLVGACNQSSNRWPVVQYDGPTVQRTLDGLKTDGLVRFVHPSHGERTTKYRQVLNEALGLGRDEAAVLCVLFLRGPQTVGELRTRTDRLHAFASTGEVAEVLDRLAARDDALVERLERRPGEREERWRHTLAPAPAGDVPATPAPASRAEQADGLAGRVDQLEDRVARLEAILGDLDPSS